MVTVVPSAGNMKKTLAPSADAVRGSVAIAATSVSTRESAGGIASDSSGALSPQASKTRKVLLKIRIRSVIVFSYLYQAESRATRNAPSNVIVAPVRYAINRIRYFKIVIKCPCPYTRRIALYKYTGI